MDRGLSFRGFSEALPEPGSLVDFAPQGCTARGSATRCRYARKHVPWPSFAFFHEYGPEGRDRGPKWITGTHVPFERDFPRSETEFRELPTVAFVIPDLFNDMHDAPEGLRPGRGARRERIDHRRRVQAGDAWLRTALGAYARWARANNSLLIVTFDENRFDNTASWGTTDPTSTFSQGAQNRIATVFAGACVRGGPFSGGPFNHVSILRTIEAMYGLDRSGKQQRRADRAGIKDGAIIEGIFDLSPKSCPGIAPSANTS